MTGRLALRAFLFAIAAMALNIAASFLYVWIYSITVAPGQDEAFYQAYAQRVAPISSIVAGTPILFAAGWLSARKAAADRAILAGALVGIIYAAVDLAIVFSVSDSVPSGIVALSVVTKLGASAFGGWVARRRNAPTATAL